MNAKEKHGFRPLGGMVLVDVIEEDQKTKSGIVLPDGTKLDNVKRAKVKSVGPGRVSEKGVRITPEVRAGEVVLISHYAVLTPAKRDGEIVGHLVAEAEMLAVVEEGK